MIIGKQFSMMFFVMISIIMLTGYSFPGSGISSSSTSVVNAEKDLGYFLNISIFKKEYSNHLLSSGEKAGIYIEYPIISGLKDLEKQDKINAIFRDELFITEYDADSLIICTVNVELSNEELLSISYSRYVNHTDAAHPNYSTHGITVDMNDGKIIHLADIMEIDERLINSSDGNIEKPNYNSETTQIFHKFKDAFEIYITENERNPYHHRAQDDVIASLKDRGTMANWYITKEKEFVFIYIKNKINIPHQNLVEIIYPKYFAALNS